MKDLPIRDAVAAFAWMAVNLLIASAGWRLSRRIHPADSLAARVIHTTVFAWAVIVAVATLLGLFRVLTPVALLISVAAAAAILAHKFGHGNIAAVSANQADRFVLFGWLILLSIGLGRVIEEGLLEFPRDWDSLMYHIPLIDQWLQARSLYAPREAVWYNPGNNELMGLWIVAPFSGDFLIGLNNLPAAILLSLGAIELARQVKMCRVLACLAGLAIVSNDVVIRQLSSAENDLAVAGLFLLSVYYALRHAHSGRLNDLLPGAAAVGLLAGIKYYALGYAFVAGASLVVAAVLGRGRRAAVRSATMGLFGTILLGGYWYIRNAWLTGTPLYPKGYDAQTDVLAQWRTDIWSSTLLGNGRSEVLSLLIDAVRRKACLSQMFSFLAAPLTICWLAVTGWRSKHYGDKSCAATVRFTVAFALAGAGVVWGCIPFAVETKPLGSLNSLQSGYLPVRFGLPFLSLSVVGIALVLCDLGYGLEMGARYIGRALQAVRGVRIFGAISLLPILAFCIVLGYQFFLQTTHLSLESVLTGMNIGLSLALGYFCVRRWPALRIWTAVSLLVAAAMATEYRAFHWHAEFSPFYDRYFEVTSFSRLAKRDPAICRICTLEPRYYPLFGSKRQFQVARPLAISNCDAFCKYLSTHNCTVVVASMSDPVNLSQYREGRKCLMVVRPELFLEIERNGVFIIFEVDKPRFHDEETNLRPLDLR